MSHNKSLLNYDRILGTDILYMLGIIFDFQAKAITWQEFFIHMKLLNCSIKEFFYIKESLSVINTTKRIKDILDAKYNKINLSGMVNNLTYSND